METSLYSLLDLKTLAFGNGWGEVPDLLLENMTSWQYDELRLGYNLHFHTHNEFTEHLVALGFMGGFLFLVYMYFIFKESSKCSISAKLGWLLFFKINCFWFLWTGTLAVFALVVSCFITFDFLLMKKTTIFHNNKLNRLILSFVGVFIGFFLLYGAFLTYQSAKVSSNLNFEFINEHTENNKNSSNKECLSFYNDNQRGGYALNRYLSLWVSNLILYNVEDIQQSVFDVLKEIRCKANILIESKNFNSNLLATALRMDNDYHLKYSSVEINKDYITANYYKWFNKAKIVAETMPKRGDLLLPFLSYAVKNDKTNDALEICNKKILGIEAFCYLIKASNLLSNPSIDDLTIKKSIKLINKAIDEGLFNEYAYGFWIWTCLKGSELFCNHGIKGIPLSPDIIFLISDKEKQRLENIIN